jgi:hypothetical protein
MMIESTHLAVLAVVYYYDHDLLLTFTNNNIYIKHIK